MLHLEIIYQYSRQVGGHPLINSEDSRGGGVSQNENDVTEERGNMNVSEFTYFQNAEDSTVTDYSGT